LLANPRGENFGYTR